MSDRIAEAPVMDADAAPGVSPLDELLAAQVEKRPAPYGGTRIEGVLVGRLVGFTDNGATPLVTYRAQPAAAALPARTTMDLQTAHIGREAVLMFDEGDPYRPIVIGCLHEAATRSLPDRPDQVEVDADGRRLIVSATDQIVLRCGKASITLTKEGKVIVQGAYVSQQSSGVLRLKGGSVHIN